MSQRLSTLDTAFLHAEDTDPHTQLCIGGPAILEGPMPDHAPLMATLADRALPPVQHGPPTVGKPMPLRPCTS